ncbi:hypothetical protein HK102_012257 [Quaeritorhiza haematococci]|nr:hypothetical protein HK102_012257 [Quaeritorhiza haematococci]
MARDLGAFRPLSQVFFVALAFLCSVELLGISAVPAPGKLIHKVNKNRLLRRATPAEDEVIKPLSEKDTPSALVVGAGPAGLYSAIKLARKGFNVSIIEKNPAYLERQYVLGANHDAARAILKKNIPEAGCITLSPDVAKYPQCLDTQRRDNLVASSDGALTESDFLQTFTAREVLDGFRVEFTNTAKKQMTGNHDIKMMDLSEVSAEMLGRSDVIVCADGESRQCRERFLQWPHNTPHGFRLFDDYPRPIPRAAKRDAYGATVVVEAQYIPENRRQEILTLTSSERISSPQQLYRGFLGSDGLFYIGLAITHEEYQHLDGIDQNSDAFRTAFVSAVRHRILGALKFFDMEDLRDIIMERGSFTAFPIPLQHQGDNGFASLVSRNGKWGKRSGEQIAIVVGDAAISSHFFSASGLNLGLQVADAAVSFLDSDFLAADGKFLGEVKNFFGHLERKKKKLQDIVWQINRAASKIAVDGRKMSYAVLPPWTRDPTATGVAVL